MISNFLFLILGYLCGSVANGLIVANYYGVKDLRSKGSGNIGATNVIRVIGKKAGYITLLLDFLKGFIPVIIALIYAKVSHNSHPVAQFCAFGTLLGHSFPVYFGFKGGKCVATGFGTLLALCPVPALLSGIVFLLVKKYSQYVSAGSLSAAITAFIFVIAFNGKMANVVYVGLAAIFIVIRHRKNISRLLNGEENKFTI